MEAIQIAKLTNEYKQTVEQEWLIVRSNDTEMQLLDVYVTLTEKSEKSEKKRMDLSQVLNKFQNLVFLGEPGSGKTTTLQFIGLCFVHKDWSVTKLNSQMKYIPIKLDLRRYATTLAEPGPAMEKAVSLSIREYLRYIDEEQALELIRVWQEQEILLLLLDGLDEVPDNLRETVRNEIRRFTLSHSGLKSRLILSARTTGYSFMMSTCIEFELESFKSADDIQSCKRPNKMVE